MVSILVVCRPAMHDIRLAIGNSSVTFLGGVTKTDSGMPVSFETYRLRVSLAATSCQCPLKNLPRRQKSLQAPTTCKIPTLDNTLFR